MIFGVVGFIFDVYAVYVGNSLYICREKRNMIMRSRLFLFGRSLSLLCLVTLLFVGCQKEDGAKRFSIFTESYRGTAKVVVDGLSSSWRAGDGIWVNGEQGTVALDDGAPILDIHVTSWGGLLRILSCIFC